MLQLTGEHVLTMGNPMIEPKRITILEFDTWVRTADEGFTYELHDGIIYAFATGTQNHGDLCSNVGKLVLPAVNLPCRAYLGSISVRRKPERPSSVVPDLTVTCEEREPANTFVRLPKLVVEVISPSSVTNDLVRKIRIYNAIESIEEYLVIDSRTMWARVFRRDADAQLWADGQDLTSPDDRIELQTLDIAFSLEALYAGIA
jgi:Uma2 family endonuclease